MAGQTYNLGINLSSNLGNSVTQTNRLSNAFQDLADAADDAGDEVDDASRSTRRAGQGVSDLQNSLEGAIGQLQSFARLTAVAFALDAIKDFGVEAVSTAGKYEKLLSVLENTLGAESARRSFAQISEYAARTPSSVDEITSSFIKLVNRGFKPTTQQLTQIGDLAASQGKSFDQLTEAILDAQTGEFERLKEFGILARQSNDSVSLAFKGTTVEVEKNSAAIRNAILAFGDLNGVAGATAKTSETLEGKISNLGDSWERFQAQLGKTLLPATKVALDGLSSTLDGLTKTLRGFGSEGRVSRVQDVADKTFNDTLEGLQKAAAKGADAEKAYREQLKAQQAKYYDDEIDLLNKSVAARGRIQRETFQDQAKAAGQSIKAIGDAITEFEKLQADANKGEAFGSGKNEKTLADVLDDLRNKLISLDTAFVATGGSLNKLSTDKISAIADALKEASSDFGVRPGDAIFNQLKSQIDTLQNAITRSPVTLTLPIEIGKLDTPTNRAAIEGIAYGLSQDFTRAFTNANREAIRSILESGARDGISALAEGIGQALNKGGGIENILSSFVSALASFGESLGKQLISQGIAIEAFKTSLESLNGVGAIAAGAALIAASAAFRGLAKGGIASFATGGGIVGGPQLAMIGDNPGREEYVIPSEVLDKMGGGMSGDLRVTLSGSEFIVWLERQYKING